MKETLENIMLMGLGAMAMTSEKAKDLKEELLKKGKEAYKEGEALNEELKHKINEKMKESVTISVKKIEITKDDIINEIDKLSEEDKKEILKVLRAKKDVK